LHAAVALEIGSGALLGLADAKIWNRDEGEVVAPRRSRATVDKESQRWLDTTARAGKELAAANSITAISDRESDIYEHFASRPSNVHLIVRACQNRKLRPNPEDAGALLFPFSDGLPEAGRYQVKVPAAPGRKERVAELAVRFAPIELCKPRNGAASELAKTIGLTLVDVREVSRPEDGEPIHWRLLTSRTVTDFNEARRIVDLYRMRWTIDIDQSWRLSRFCGLVAGMGGRWWQATPRSRRCSYLFQGSDGGGIGVHQFSAAGASFDHAAA
jgi:hypothetical protein